MTIISSITRSCFKFQQKKYKAKSFHAFNSRHLNCYFTALHLSDQVHWFASIIALVLKPVFLWCSQLTGITVLQFLFCSFNNYFNTSCPHTLLRTSGEKDTVPAVDGVLNLPDADNQISNSNKELRASKECHCRNIHRWHMLWGNWNYRICKRCSRLNGQT